MEVPEPPSMGTTGSLLMEQIPKVRQSLTRGHDWDALALRATSKPSSTSASGGGGGAFCTYDDANDPDVKSAAALFSAGEHEDWGGGAGEGQLEEPGAVDAAAPAGKATAMEAVRVAQAEAGTSREKGLGGGSGGGGRGGEAPASSVHA